MNSVTKVEIPFTTKGKGWVRLPVMTLDQALGYKWENKDHMCIQHYHHKQHFPTSACLPPQKYSIC